jgi:2,4-dienoyl-CoA reductase-like NADH-dependent reductase (Old Yellow Enzyme family)
VERTRFGAAIVRACREAVGPDFPIVLRFSQWKQQDYGAKLAQNPDELSVFLAPLVDAGVDVFHCSTRRFWLPEFEGSDLNLAGWTKRLTGKPTITVGSVGLDQEFLGAFGGQNSEVRGLEELILRFDRGEFDLVAVGRALLQDPEWVEKVGAGRTAEIRAFDASSMKTLY